ncbi:MAG: DUF364 domain-containing protein [Clostridiales Family XIII bacterium]|jgi:uncharacterized protein (DUF4213/DUF364 family)|nr:DUF364 domain-containing protein [Clostridiales Family XIII bacterium]
MWKLFDDLIDGIDPGAAADSIICGTEHSAVRCGDTVGVSVSISKTWRSAMLPKKAVGMPLRELAACIKSWDFNEAVIGLAAINAWYNNIGRLRGLGLYIPDAAHVEDRSADPFIAAQKEIAGKTVTSIGHFPYIDQLFAPVCKLSVIEKFHPGDGDYPEQAADYLLPASDYVFISSYTFAEKSLPRYLELAKNAHVTTVGASSPMAPLLGKYGVNAIAGFAVKDPAAAERVSLGLGGKMRATGQKINLQL